MRVKAKSFEEYFQKIDALQRSALQKLCGWIKSAAPSAEEYMSYGLPAYRVDGKRLLALGVSANHCALYPMSASTVKEHSDELKDFETSKGTIRFTPQKPLSAALVRKLVHHRIAENDQLADNEKSARKSPATKSSSSKVRSPISKNNASVSKIKSKAPESDDPAVEKFLSDLNHPLKQALMEVRAIILAASPKIHEGIKWNSPSFRTTDYFATINVHGKDKLRLILHTGAKVKETASQGLKIADPSGLLQWLAKDRCLVTLGDCDDVKSKSAALKKLIREWVRQFGISEKHKS